jgi:CxxC motif-containing protein (DUF1111 family)
MRLKKNYKILATLILIVITLADCQKMFPPAPKEENDISNGVIPGLTPQQLAEHAVGDNEFSRIFTQQDGLGPVFNQPSCNSCHIGNGKGDPVTVLTRFGKTTGTGFDSLVNENGPDLLPNAIPGYLGDVLPADANAVTHRIAPIVMGQGFIAALSDSSILANAYPHDGVSGRPNYVNPTPFFIPQPIHIPLNGKYIGRFGKKAIKVSLQDQVVFALKKDLGGITSDYDQTDVYNYLVGINSGNIVQDPRVSAGFVNHLVFYLRTLKVPPRRNTTDPDVIAGEQLFNGIGCTSCHIPTMVTASSDIAALSNQTFHPFSDFLLHDMGSGLDDGVPEGSAQSFEWRTAPLWGIGLAGNSQGGQLFLLHDGRATSFSDAIAFHGGEAASRRQAFFTLSQPQQAQIIKFLQSL